MTVKRAKLVEIKWDAKQEKAKPGDPKHDVDVHFNPQSLKVSFSNKVKGGDQPGGSSKQATGSRETKLSVELLFDTTADGKDVREITKKVAYFITGDDGSGNKNKNHAPPGVQFEWGSFVFRGITDAMNETLDYFSEDGVPLRATITLDITRQEIEFLPGQAGQGGGGGAPTNLQLTPLKQARAGESLQGAAGREGKSGDWKSIAAANNIDDPLRLSAGALIDMDAGISVGGSIGVSGGIGASVSTSAGASASTLAKASTSAGVTARATASASVNAGVNLGASLQANRR